MNGGEAVSIISLVLAVVFWLLSTRQANDAKRTLNEIKTEIISWQNELNKAAIGIISSRPEMIAKETAAIEATSLRDFSTNLTQLIEKTSSDIQIEPEAKEQQLKILNQLLDHHKNLILGKQQLLNQAIALQSGQHAVPTNSKQDESKS